MRILLGPLRRDCFLAFLSLACCIVTGIPMALGVFHPIVASENEPIEFAGIIQDSNQRPADQANLTFRWETSAGEREIRLTTDSQGRFSAQIPIDRNQLHHMQAEAVSRDGKRGGYVRIPSQKDSPLDQLQVTLEPLKQAKIQVKDQDGRPVEAAEVGVLLRYPIALWNLHTDTNGRVRVRIPESHTIETVACWKAGYGADYRSYQLSRGERADMNAVVPEFPYESGLELQLEGASPISVRLVDEDERPLADATIRPWLLSKPDQPNQLNMSLLGSAFSQKTDQDGRTTFAWIPNWQKQPITFWPSVPNYVRSRGSYNPLKGDGTLAIQLQRLVPLRGHVHREDGKAVANVQVVARGAGYTFDDGRASATSEENGFYELWVPPDQMYLVVINDSNWASKPHDGLIVEQGSAVEDLDFVLRKPTRVFGKLVREDSLEVMAGENVFVYQYGTDLNSLDGGSLPNPENSSRYVRPTVVHHAQTDSDGRFEFHLGDGHFDIRPPTQEKADKFEIEGQESIELTVTTKVKTEVSLVGLVVQKKDQTPAGNAQIEGVAQNFRGKDWRATTKLDGKFQVMRYAEPTYIRALSEDQQWSAVVHIESDQKTLVMQLEKVGSANGRLLDVHKTAPAANVEINYGIRVPDEDNRTWSYRFGGRTATDAEGRFTLDSLVPNHEYTLNLAVTSDGHIPQVGSLSVQPGDAIDMGDLSIPEPPKRYVPPLSTIESSRLLASRNPLRFVGKKPKSWLDCSISGCCLLLEIPNNPPCGS